MAVVFAGDADGETAADISILGEITGLGESDSVITSLGEIAALGDAATELGATGLGESDTGAPSLGEAADDGAAELGEAANDGAALGEAGGATELGVGTGVGDSSVAGHGTSIF